LLLKSSWREEEEEEEEEEEFEVAKTSNLGEGRDAGWPLLPPPSSSEYRLRTEMLRTSWRSQERLVTESISKGLVATA